MDVRGIDNLRVGVQEYGSLVGKDADLSVLEGSQGKVKAIEKQDGVKGEEEQSLSEKEQQRRMVRLQDTLRTHNIEISYNEEVNRYAIKVLDSESKEVVKEIPSEKMLEMFARMLEIEGILVDEKR